MLLFSVWLLSSDFPIIILFPLSPSPPLSLSFSRTRAQLLIMQNAVYFRPYDS